MSFRLSGCRVVQGHVAGARRVGERLPVDRDLLVSFDGSRIGNRHSRSGCRIVVVKLACPRRYLLLPRRAPPVQPVAWRLRGLARPGPRRQRTCRDRLPKEHVG